MDSSHTYNSFTLQFQQHWEAIGKRLHLLFPKSKGTAERRPAPYPVPQSQHEQDTTDGEPSNPSQLMNRKEQRHWFRASLAEGRWRTVLCNLRTLPLTPRPSQETDHGPTGERRVKTELDVFFSFPHRRPLACHLPSCLPNLDYLLPVIK